MSDDAPMAGPFELPHGEAARFAVAALEVADEKARCLARVPTDSPFRRGSRVPSIVALEMAAQSVAALGRGGLGGAELMVVAVQHARIHRPFLRADADYDVRVALDAALGALRVARFEVSCGELLVAEGVLSLASRLNADARP